MTPMLSDSKPPVHEAEPQAPAYVYPPRSVTGDGTKTPSPAGNTSTLERLWVPDPRSVAPGPAAVSEDQIRAREVRARKEGRDEGVALGLAEFEKKLAGEKQSLVVTVREFARERVTYFQRVEGEEVALAVAIARKILHREAQVDPLLLAGVVRVGLDNVRSEEHTSELQSLRHLV